MMKPKSSTGIEEQAQLSSAMFGLYNCLTDPEQLPIFIDILGTWLADEASDPDILQFEKHSEIAWSGILRNLQDASAEEIEHQARIMYFDERANPVGHYLGFTNLKEHLNQEDLIRLENWHSNDIREPLLVRNFSDFENAEFSSGSLTKPTFMVLHAVTKSDLTAPKNAAFCFKSPCYGISQTIENIFRTTFGISNAEIRVLKHLVEGLNTIDVAAKLGKSIETIRSNVKSITSKMGISSQNEILATVLQLEKQLNRTTPEHSKLPEGDSFVLSDGSRMGFRTYGPIDGEPVLFVHNLGAGRHLPISIVPKLTRKGVRLIVPARPGHGISTLREPNAKSALIQAIDNMAQLTHALGYSRTNFITDGIGLAHAFEYARVYPQRCGSILALDPAPPALTREDLDQYEGRFRRLVATTMRSKFVLKMVLRLAYLDYRKVKSKDDLHARNYFRSSTPEQASFSPSELDARWANFKENMELKLSHFIYDMELLISNYSYFPEGSNMQPPLRILQTHGNPFLRPGALEGFAAKIGAEVYDAGPTYPLVEGQIDAILDHLQSI